jgi:preprotein translocase subunit SecG
MVLACFVFLGEIISPSKGALIRALVSSPPSLSGSQGVALRLSQMILVLVMFFTFSVGGRERIRRM